MKKLKMFYLEGCPYCKNARRACEELKAEGPKSAGAEVEIEWINEAEEPEIAQEHSYSYVPCAFLGAEKLYEAYPGESYVSCKEGIRKALEKAARSL